MLRKLTFAGMVAVLAVFASLLGGPANPALADPGPAAQTFDIDAINCLVFWISFAAQSP